MVTVEVTVRDRFRVSDRFTFMSVVTVRIRNY